VQSVFSVDCQLWTVTRRPRRRRRRRRRRWWWW